MLLTEGNRSDFVGAALMLDKLPKAAVIIGDRGYDADWFRKELKDLGIQPCIPPKKNRIESIEYDVKLYRRRHKIENIFARIKDWRRIAMRYDRCAHTFFSAICIAAIFCFWINQ